MFDLPRGDLAARRQVVCGRLSEAVDLEGRLGAKTALLAFADGDIRSALRGAARAERADTKAPVRQVHPGYDVEPADDGTAIWT